MNRRENVLSWMRIAGYHDDKRRFTRLLIENRISRKAADEAWQQGRRQYASGVPCACYDCNKA
jgi:hypothetical protein